MTGHEQEWSDSAGAAAAALAEKARELLRIAGIDCATPPSITRLIGGANNAVFRLDMPRSRYILKQYFSHAADQRDRYGAETKFAAFLWRHAVRVIPQLLACDPAAKLALFEFVEGTPLAPAEVDESHVDQAVALCAELRRLQALPEAQSLPEASEACFSLQEHLNCVGRRIAALESISPTTDAHRQARCLVADELAPRWEAVRGRVVSRVGAHAGRLDRVLSPAERVLSPSDFGFHNALRTNSGRLCFLDFEYAGWDDPAKLICDFFCQVEVPVPRWLMPRFTECLERGSLSTMPIGERVECLFPVYLLKWCAIVLNDFLPVASLRRRFSAAGPQRARRLELQLEKARQLLRNIEISSS